MCSGGEKHQVKENNSSYVHIYSSHTNSPFSLLLLSITAVAPRLPQMGAARNNHPVTDGDAGTQKTG